MSQVHQSARRFQIAYEPPSQLRPESAATSPREAAPPAKDVPAKKTILTALISDRYDRRILSSLTFQVHITGDRSGPGILKFQVQMIIFTPIRITRLRLMTGLKPYGFFKTALGISGSGVSGFQLGASTARRD